MFIFNIMVAVVIVMFEFVLNNSEHVCLCCDHHN